MTRRLQVLLDDEEMRDIQATARRHKMTTAEWVRGALRAARLRASPSDSQAKLAAIRAAARLRYPAPPIDDMLAEIERGYLGEDPS
jgi:hypothetical protein